LVAIRSIDTNPDGTRPIEIRSIMQKWRAIQTKTINSYVIEITTQFGPLVKYRGESG
jgi:hypothetical protein